MGDRHGLEQRCPSPVLGMLKLNPRNKGHLENRVNLVHIYWLHRDLRVRLGGPRAYQLRADVGPTAACGGCPIATDAIANYMRSA